jgi:hypothetical protein
MGDMGDDIAKKILYNTIAIVICSMALLIVIGHIVYYVIMLKQ